MKLEGRVYCEGPDCPLHERVGVDTMEAGRLPIGWLKVTEYSTNSEEAFCGWNCLMRRAAMIPPPIEFNADELGGLFGDA